ncbi:MAG: molybdenum cofactor guanylyltransferase [Candidatus Zixiibacteriota bacterium]
MVSWKREVAGIILTGGQSSRMGFAKALLPLGGRPLWRIAADIISPHVATTIFVGEVPGFAPPPPYELYPDLPSGKGPLGGIATGLEVSGFENNLVLAVDYPFIQTAYLELLLARCGDARAVCGRSGPHLEPLIAYYHSDCAPVIRRMLQDDESRPHRLFDLVPSVILSEDEIDTADPRRRSFINLNSPDDLANALLLGNEE